MLGRHTTLIAGNVTYTRSACIAKISGDTACIALVNMSQAGVLKNVVSCPVSSLHVCLDLKVIALFVGLCVLAWSRSHTNKPWGVGVDIPTQLS